MALTPFDIAKYRKAQPVQTREGLKINNLKEMQIPEIDQTYLTAVISGKPYVWNIDGQRDFYFNTPDPYDLFMDDPIDYKWVAQDNILDFEGTDPGVTYRQVKVIESL